MNKYLNLNNLEESIIDAFKRGELSTLKNFTKKIVEFVESGKAVREMQIWISEKNQWHMMNDLDEFIQEFFDCANLHRYFPELDKFSVNLYRVDISKVNT